MSDVSSASVSAPSAPTPVSESTGPVSDGITSSPKLEMNDSSPSEGVDDATLMEEAIAIANGKSADRASAEPVGEKPGAEVSKPAAEPAAEPEPAKEEPKTAQQWAKLLAKEKALAAQESKFKEREARLADFEDTVASGNIEKALKLLGYDDGVKFLQDVAENGAKGSKANSEVSAIRKELAAMKAEREAEKKAVQQQAQQRQREEAISAKKAEIAAFLKNDSTYSKGLVGVEYATNDLFAVMQSHYQETKAKTGRGEELPIAKAAEILEKRWQAGIEVLTKNPKAREIFAKALAADGPVASKPKVATTRVVAAPAQQDDDFDPSGEKELREATAWMKKRAAARRAQ